MPELNDHELLAEFARTESETAFATLVARHVNLVYSTALRTTGNPHDAEEITQAVFVILARKAGKLSLSVVLSGWLYQAARLTAANLVKGEIRRHHREQEAFMQSTLNEPDAGTWKQVAPLLEDAMGGLGESDRNALVLRFFEKKTAAEVADALKMTEAAAHKRVNRALDKLRKIFSKRGVTLSSVAIAGTLSANSVQAAPVALAKSITALAITKGVAASGSTLTLIKGALKIMAWTKAKTAIVAGVVVILAACTATELVIKHRRHVNRPAPTAAAGSGESSPQQLQGHWTGSNTAHPGQSCTLDISGDQIEYRGTDPNDWLRGKFTLDENANPHQVSVTILEPASGFVLGIYQLNGDKMTIAAAEHGNSRRPVNFSASRQVDVLELQRD